jgi:dTMP kinase
MNYFMLVLFLFFIPFKAFPEGYLIEVCGIDGSGKSTFIQDLKSALTEKGRKVVILKPLSGNPAIYKLFDEFDVLSSLSDDKLSERVDQFKSDYFFFSLLTHKFVIDRYLSEDYVVLCDRYIYSYKTYQECFDQSIKEDETLLNKLPVGKNIFLITVPIEIAISRIESRESVASYENTVFLKRAQDIFLRDAGQYPNLVHLDGSAMRQSNVDIALSILGIQL